MKQLTHRPHGQQGATLIITLVMLVLITLVGVSSIRKSTIDEKTAGASRDRDKAFQAAEAAVQTCLVQLKNLTYTGTTLAPTGAGAAPHWEASGNWSNGNSNVVAVDSDGLYAQPRCMVEALGAGTGSYRVTGRAVGASSVTEVVLQATFSTE